MIQTIIWIMDLCTYPSVIINLEYVQSKTPISLHSLFIVLKLQIWVLNLFQMNVILRVITWCPWRMARKEICYIGGLLQMFIQFVANLIGKNYQIAYYTQSGSLSKWRWKIYQLWKWLQTLNINYNENF